MEAMPGKLRFFERCKPTVARRFLLLIAGLLWSGVGILLCSMAGGWLLHTPWPTNMLGAGVGIASGILIYRYGFSRIALKNIERISRKPEQVCLFAFQAWRSYLLITVMMALGFILRHSGLPRYILAVIYSAVGSGLTLSSILYYERML
jgi:hypothetical protein